MLATFLCRLEIKEYEFVDWCWRLLSPQVAVVFVNYIFLALTALPLAASMTFLAPFLEVNLGFTG